MHKLPHSTSSLNQTLRAGCRPVLLIVLILLIVLPVAAMASLDWLSIYDGSAEDLLLRLWVSILGMTAIAAALLRSIPGFEQILNTRRWPSLLITAVLLITLCLFALFSFSPIDIIVASLLSIAVTAIAATPLRSNPLLDQTIRARRWPSLRTMLAMLIVTLIGAMMSHRHIVPLTSEDILFVLCLVWSLTLVTMVGAMIILRSSPLSDPALRTRRRLLLLTLPALLSALIIGAVMNWNWLIDFITAKPHIFIQILPSVLLPLPIVVMAIAAAPLHSTPLTYPTLRAARWPLPRIVSALLISAILTSYPISKPPAAVGTVLLLMLVLLLIVAMAIAAAPLYTNPLLQQTLRASRRPSPRMTFALLIVLLIGTTVGRGWLIHHIPIEAHSSMLFLTPLVTMAVAATSTARRLHAESFQLLEQSPLNYHQVIWGLGLSTLYNLRIMLMLVFSLLVITIDNASLGAATQIVLGMIMLNLAASMFGAGLSRTLRSLNASMPEPLQAGRRFLPWVALVLLIVMLIASMIGWDWLIGLLPVWLRGIGWPLLWLLPLITIAVTARPLRSNPLLDETIRTSRQPSLRTTFLLLAMLLVAAMVARGWLLQHLPAELRHALLLLPWLLPLVTLAVAALSTALHRRTESFQLAKQSLRNDLQVAWGLGLGTLYNLRVVLALAFGLLFALVDDTFLHSPSTVLGLSGLHLAASMLGAGLSSALRSSGAPILRPLRSNPLLDQTLHAGSRPSLRITLVLLAALITSAIMSRAWLIDRLPADARAVLLLLLWLLPLVTMVVAAASTARRLRTEGFQLVRQSPLTDRQVTWGLGLSTLYTLRVVLVLAFGLLPALGDNTPLGGASIGLCLAGLHLAASMLGTMLVLRWGRQRLGVVLAALCCTLILALLPTLNTLLLPMPAPGCPSTFPIAANFTLSTLLPGWELDSPLPVIAAAVLPTLVSFVASLIPWRGREESRLPQLEMLGIVLVIGLALGLRVIDASQVDTRERQALVALYEATGGENWRVQDGWLSDQPMCSWRGVSCACDRVVGLRLDNNNLRGKLPPEFGQLTGLTWLDLSGNQLTTLPPEFGQLASLQELWLRGNQLTTLPPEFGQLASLQELWLRGNQLTTLPPEFGQLASLQNLELFDNRLTTLPPEFGQLASLQQLWLSGNPLTTLPPEFGQLASLQNLVLSNTPLTTLPPEFGQLASLQVLYLHDNQLIFLPPEFGQLASLQVLYLHNNQLTFLPPEFGQLTSLKELYLYGNQLTTLSPEFGQLASLQVLALFDNQLTTLPPEFGQLASLQGLALSNNRLTTLPPEFGQLASLRGLDLSFNQITTLPPEFGQLTSLRKLGLFNNQLTTLPPEFGRLTNLEELDLSFNQLTTLPPEFSRLASLQTLYLSGNQLTTLPPEICQMPGLYMEELCDN